MNEKNMKEIEKLWYKIIKSTVGATFIRKTIAEVILGMPPIMLQNKIHSQILPQVEYKTSGRRQSERIH